MEIIELNDQKTEFRNILPGESFALVSGGVYMRLNSGRRDVVDLGDGSVLTFTFDEVCMKVGKYIVKEVS